MGTMLADSLDQIFISNVLDAMERQGMSKSELARLSGVTRPYLTNLLNGKVQGLTTKTVEKISIALGVPAPQLFS